MLASLCFLMAGLMMYAFIFVVVDNYISYDFFLAETFFQEIDVLLDFSSEKVVTRNPNRNNLSAVSHDVLSEVPPIPIKMFGGIRNI